MKERYSAIFSDYGESFSLRDNPFLFYYSFENKTEIKRKSFTRGEFLALAQRAAHTLKSSGCRSGDRILHCFGCNDYHDLAFRVAGVMIGTTPVTINWQADTFERIVYKFTQTNANMVIFNHAFDKELLSELRKKLPHTPFFDVARLEEQLQLAEEEYSSTVDINATKMIIFTSGTTGNPKGVELTYKNYQINRRALEQMLATKVSDRFAALVVNPMHHTNSTAITDWALRRPGAELHMLERYSTKYWQILTEVVEKKYDRIVAPLVSRHFDFLEELTATDRLPVDEKILKQAMQQIDFLIGSAPVGPTTVQRTQNFTGRIPAVRFGSTETCLQVIGIPESLSEKQKLKIFKKGWDHKINGQPNIGYFIGRPHKPYTEAKIVQSITRGEKGFMQEVEPDTPGFLIIRGENVMKCYVNDAEKTSQVFHEGWYLGLEDICFALKNEEDGENDYYWMSRDSALLIRGGSNYSCDQINAELNEFLASHFDLPQESFHLAAAGLKVDSEHEDSCCITIELLDQQALDRQELIAKTFLQKARETVSKGAKPDYLRFAKIPLNFKGAILLNDLKKEYAQHLEKAVQK